MHATKQLFTAEELVLEDGALRPTSRLVGLNDIGACVAVENCLPSFLPPPMQEWMNAHSHNTLTLTPTPTYK